MPLPCARRAAEGRWSAELRHAPEPRHALAGPQPRRGVTCSGRSRWSAEVRVAGALPGRRRPRRSGTWPGSRRASPWGQRWAEVARGGEPPWAGAKAREPTAEASAWPGEAPLAGAGAGGGAPPCREEFRTSVCDFSIPSWCSSSSSLISSQDWFVALDDGETMRCDRGCRRCRQARRYCRRVRGRGREARRRGRTRRRGRAAPLPGGSSWPDCFLAESTC